MILLRKIKERLCDEKGATLLEAAAICVVVCIITAYLLRLLGVVTDMGVLRNGWTSSTGWFKSSDITGIMN